MVGLDNEDTGTIEFFRAGFSDPNYAITTADADTFNNITFGNGSLNFSAGSSTYTINGKLKIGSGAGSVSVNGNTLLYGPNSTIEYTPGTNFTIGAEWTNSLFPANVTINSTGDLIQTTTERTVRKTLTLTAGTIDLGSDTLYVLGDLTGGDVAGSGTVADNTILAMGNGAGSTQSQSITGTINLKNLQINKTGGGANPESANNTVTVNGQLKFSPSSRLEVANGTLAFTSSGRLDATNIGSLTLEVQSGGVVKTGGQALTGIGTISAASGKIIFNSDAGESLPTGTSIGILEINNSSGVQTTGPSTLMFLTVLNFVNGVITTTAANVLILEDTVVIDGAVFLEIMLIGPMQRRVNSTSCTSFSNRFNWQV